jgi:hypothetical protein
LWLGKRESEWEAQIIRPILRMSGEYLPTKESLGQKVLDRYLSEEIRGFACRCQ